MTHRDFKISLLASAAAISLMSTPAFSASPELVAAAEMEGKVIWYTTMIVDQAVRPMAAAFEAKYPGVEVQFSRAGGADTALKVVNEVQAGQVQGDVFDSLSAYNSIRAADAVEPYIADSAKALPDVYRDPEGYWAAPNVYFLSAAYNTDLVSADTAPKTFDDLLDPKWKGQMVWSTVPQESGAPGFVGNVLMTMGDENGVSYLKKLAAQDITPMDSSQRTVLDRVILGDFALGLMTYTHHSPISAAKGAPVNWLRIEPLIASPNTLGLIKDGPHPNAGKLLIDFVLSEQGQSILADAMYLPTNPAVTAKVPELLPTGPQPFTFTFMSPQLVKDQLGHWIEVQKTVFH